MSTAAPPAPDRTPDYPPSDLQPPRRGRLFAWVARKPKTAFWVTAITALILGIMIGGSGGTDQSKLDAATARATAAEGKASKLQSQLSQTTDRAQTAEGQIAELKDQVATLS